MKGKRIGFLAGFFFLFFLIVFYVLPGLAEAVKHYPVSGYNYVLPEDSNYDYSNVRAVESFFYGQQGMGTLYVSGAVDGEGMYNGYPAYSTTGELIIRYAYNGKYRKTAPESWHVESDGTRWIRDYDLGFLNNIGFGCMMIEKSSDTKNWEKIVNPIKNYFNKAKSGEESVLCRIPESDYMNGMYYRVVVAYKFARRTLDTFLHDEYDQKKCVEVYQFYVASDESFVTFQDLSNGRNLVDQSSTETGFMIRKNGKHNTVKVRGEKHERNDFECIVDPGKYTIDVTTPFGKTYSQTITVTNGIDFTLLTPNIYQSEKDKGFALETFVKYPAFGSSLTSLSLAIPKGFEITQNKNRYGITGNSISLYLKINKAYENLGGGWKVTYDKWGKNKNQLVNGVQTGEIGHGALIVQTSTDGKKWEKANNGRYRNGIYTTDYAFCYETAENVLIYTPLGRNVINGEYIRVWFAYQIYSESQKKYHDYIEEYLFYLCSNELGAVTFHNLSVADKIDKTFADEDHNTIEVYKQAESLKDGGYTTTGFEIDNQLNPTVKHTVSRNGQRIVNSRGVFEETGKYDITLTSAVGSIKEMTIYVDRLTPEEAMEEYFGNGFLSGKRIFSDGEYPVYEGGEVNYHVAGVNENIVPLCGRITNMTTGSVILIEQNRDEKKGVIVEPGMYQALFATSEKVFTGDLTGDARVFKYQFQVIQQGTAPGPVINKKLLDEYCHLTVTDCYPVYYGLTYSSAGKGYITLAFASKEAAVEYAYNYEKGTVEKQDDGSYRYTGSFFVTQKTKIDSTWDLTDAVNYFAEAAVQKHFFNMSDKFTYLSMSSETLEKYSNLRKLELDRSITLFADNQKAQLSSIEALPFLNDKPCVYYDPETGEVNTTFESFEFVTDAYGGIDSKNVLITDCEGGQHQIRYSESVGQQLLAGNCPSGIVTIREETMYGDFAEYQAIYIAPNENQTELTLTYTQNEERKSIVYKQDSDNRTGIIADSFAITGLSDPLDPYALVIIKHNQYEMAFTGKDDFSIVWTDPGKYSITCVNRMGYGFEVSLSIEGGEGSTADDVRLNNALHNNVQDSDYAMAYRQWQEASTQKDGTKMKKDEEKKTRDNTALVIICVLAGMGLVIGLIIFIRRRISLFSRMSNAIKSEEGDRHD